MVKCKYNETQNEIQQIQFFGLIILFTRNTFTITTKEEYLKDKPLGPDMMRMCASGNIIPQQWMKNAVGNEISAKPMLNSVSEVMSRMK